MRRRKTLLPGKRQYQRQLRSLLAFLNADLAAVTHGNLVKILYDFLTFVFGEDKGPQGEFYRWLCSRADERTRTALELAQQKISRWLGDRFAEASPKDWEALPAFDYHLSYSPSYGVYRKGDQVLVLATAGHRRGSVTSVDGRLGLDKDSGALQHAVFSLMTRFPLSVLRICPDCGKFYSVTRKQEIPACRICMRRKVHAEWFQANKKAVATYEARRRKGLKQSIAEIREELRRVKAEGDHSDTS